MRLTKYVQERLTLTVAPAYGIEAAALRLFNVYGPGQALSNPYTGVLAIFASRLLNGERPMVFEDGQQRRDFVHVKDVGRAFLMALEHPGAVGKVFNIASGRSQTVEDVATGLAQAMNCENLAAGNDRQDACGRYPALLRRGRQSGAGNRIHGATRFRRGPRRTRRLGRQANRATIVSIRRAVSSKQEGSSRDTCRAIAA